MKVLFVLCVALASAHCKIWKSAIRVKWGVPLMETDYFIEIPRGLTETISQGWVETARPETPLPSLTMYCPEDDYTFCSLFDDTGYITGLQISLNTETFTDTPIDMDTIAFTKWSAPDGNEYWTQQQYFMSEETLAKTQAERLEMRKLNDKTLFEDALWLLNLDGTLLKVSTNETDIAAGIWTEQGCLPTMGLHYYYNMSSSIDCSALYPWFTITSDGEMVATGFGVYGTFPDVADGERMWFERSSVSTVEFIVPNAPECVYDLTDTPGVITMHIFYDKHPWTIGC